MIAKWLWSTFLISMLFLGNFGVAQAQDLEPRRWTHLPIGLNVMGVGLAASTGDILFDPVLLIEEATYEVNMVGLSYLRSFNLLGKTARLDVVAPLAEGRWEGLVNGMDTVVRRQGLTDPWMRFSVNLYGAPALKGKEYMQYRSEKKSHTTIGVAIGAIIPLGEYSQERLINLGSNRWTLRPQLGVLHQRENWQFELTGSVFLYQTNDEFWQGSQLKQDPLWFIQSHAIYTINPTWWTSLSLGYAHGGRSTINGTPKQDDSRSALMGLSLGYNINASQSLKLSYLRSQTNISVGRDTDTLSLGWGFRWTK